MNAPPNDDQRLEQFLGNLLRAGVTLSAIVVLWGAVVYLRQDGANVPDYRQFDPGPVDLRTIGGTLQAAWAGNGSALIQCGMLLLVATPIARVLLSVFAFAAVRDWRYVAVTLVVLGILCYSVIRGYLDAGAG